MKKLCIFFVAVFFVFPYIGCEDNANKSSFKESDIIGQWEFNYQTVNGVLQTVYPDQMCKYDQKYEFHADGTVTANNPCEWNKLVESKANWKMEDNKLFIDYYAIPGLSVNPIVVSVNGNELVLQQMWGDVDVVQNVFRKASTGIVDYAADMQGTYSGWMNYSSYYISETFRGDSIPVDVSITKKAWGNISVQYNNIDVLGERRTIVVDSVKTSRYNDERTFVLANEIGANMLFLNNETQYNIRSQGNLGITNSDSIYLYLNFSRMEHADPSNPNSATVENYYQYQRFYGLKKK